MHENIKGKEPRLELIGFHFVLTHYGYIVGESTQAKISLFPIANIHDPSYIIYEIQCPHFVTQDNNSIQYIHIYYCDVRIINWFAGALKNIVISEIASNQVKKCIEN